MVLVDMKWSFEDEYEYEDDYDWKDKDDEEYAQFTSIRLRVLVDMKWSFEDEYEDEYEDDWEGEEDEVYARLWLMCFSWEPLLDRHPDYDVILFEFVIY